MEPGALATRKWSAGLRRRAIRSTRPCAAPATSSSTPTSGSAGLVHERREGARRWYSARPEGLDDVRAYLDAMWPPALARRKAAAEREHDTGARDAGRN